MADHDHLVLNRVQRPPTKRQKSRSGWRPPRSYGDFEGHAAALEEAAAGSVEEYRRRRERVEDFDPKLILRFHLNRRVSDAEWRRAGLTLLETGFELSECSLRLEGFLIAAQQLCFELSEFRFSLKQPNASEQIAEKNTCQGGST